MNRVDGINRGMDEIKPLESIDIPPMQDKVSDEEWAIRVDLAAAYRMVAHYGWDDLIFTHISARIPGPDHHFLINPYGLLFSEISASSLVKIDLDGTVLQETPYAVNPAGFTIHSAVPAAREDVVCVLHLHTTAGVAVSCVGASVVVVAPLCCVAGASWVAGAGVVVAGPVDAGGAVVRCDGAPWRRTRTVA